MRPSPASGLLAALAVIISCSSEAPIESAGADGAAGPDALGVTVDASTWPDAYQWPDATPSPDVIPPSSDAGPPPVVSCDGTGTDECGPPPSSCLDEHYLVWYDIGVCVEGTCVWEEHLEYCEWGPCLDGGCYFPST